MKYRIVETKDNVLASPCFWPQSKSFFGFWKLIDHEPKDGLKYLCHSYEEALKVIEKFDANRQESVLEVFKWDCNEIIRVYHL